MATRILIAGAAGQLGSALLSRWHDGTGPDAGRVEAVGVGSSEMDITDPAAVREAVRRIDPGVVVNCAAYTAVDAAEADEAAAHAVNTVGAENLARACADAGCGLVHLSTDYVFSGAGPGAGTASPASCGADGYESDDPVGPHTAYGRSKAAGERAVRRAHPAAVIVRTAWVYTGAVRPGGGDFVATMRRLEAERETVDVVDDQCGSPTYVRDLARGIAELTGRLTDGPAADGPAGRTLHAAGGGAATWYEVARAVFEELGADPGRVRACRTEDMPRPAARPRYSVLSGASWAAAGLTPLRHWRPALTAALAEP
ncbi:dTDP-4-dehydrorhamnose reductase [Tomitella fengzijianii]|uniref:dTDP-4-dehydrorhamnose reductase n=1 Tax=Tomitella fengzijianii TaxID=2597660 RepID=A0A516X179_9ACTN|nr:dTDP-4-dehydrorhamnose reductase [Tomitella fengzijianii]QDQ96790.1 dTDP-4-dehydrorhamnose reductase [Tomitella fengzijianii]